MDRRLTGPVQMVEWWNRVMYRFEPTPVIDDPLYKIGKFPGDDLALDNIVKYADTLNLETGQVGFEKRETRRDCRVSQVAWIYDNPKSHWIYDLLASVVLDANARWFHYDLTGFRDSLQYTVYHGSENGHFDWHLDMGDKYGGPQRKLSLSLLLSDPSEYEGGDFELQTGMKSHTAELKDRGTVIIFPSYVLHRVTPVTKGTRKALVAWACGPKFR